MPKFRPTPEQRLGIDLAGAHLSLIDQLYQLRVEKGLTQQQLAEKIGVDRAWVSRFESVTDGTPRNVTLDSIHRYALAVNAYIAHVVIDAGSPEDGDRFYKGVKEWVARRLDEAPDASGHRETLPPDRAFADVLATQRLARTTSIEWSTPPASEPAVRFRLPAQKWEVHQ